MELLAELLPIVVFFIVFKFKGLISATMATIVVSILQIAIMKIYRKNFNPIQLISLGCLCICGLMAIVFKQEFLIKWKPTVIYWLLAIILLIAPYFGKNFVFAKINDTLNLSSKIINILNILWIIFFVFMGGLNLYVGYNFDTNTWVNFKLFGTLVITMVFVLLQALFVCKYSAKRSG